MREEVTTYLLLMNPLLLKHAGDVGESTKISARVRHSFVLIVIIMLTETLMLVGTCYLSSFPQLQGVKSKSSTNLLRGERSFGRNFCSELFERNFFSPLVDFVRLERLKCFNRLCVAESFDIRSKRLEDKGI